jgi:CBS domain-containing protein
MGRPSRTCGTKGPAARGPAHPTLVRCPNRFPSRPRRSTTTLFVTGLMTTPVVAITADARLPVALRVMAAEHVRHLLVVDDGRCVGLLQEGEVARLLLGPATPREVPPLPVGAACRAVPRLGPGERRSAAARRMHTAGVDACLVVDGERVLGIVTATDVLGSLATPAEIGRVDRGLGAAGETELAQQ